MEKKLKSFQKVNGINLISRFKMLVIFLFILLLIYLYTLFNPAFFYNYKVSFRNITVFSDESIDKDAINQILITVDERLRKSEIYNENFTQNIFITNNKFRWVYFTNVNNNVGGLNYVVFNHNVFIRKSDIENNRVISPSGNIVPDSRTLDYFITHEITHTLEYQELGITKHPLFTNWVLEGYAEYIAHGSESYDETLKQYLHVKEPSYSKYYTRIRTMIAYLLEKEKISVHDIWTYVDKYDETLIKSIPNDNPTINDNIHTW